MTPEDWLESAHADAERRGLPDLQSALEGLARAASVLRQADWYHDASGGADAAPDPPSPAG